MTISPIEVSQFGLGNQPVRAPKQAMDGEMFMHLLVTQLANQDPSSPMDTNDMIAQTTQLASMEKLNMLSATQDVSLAIQQRTAVSSLLGHQITSGGKDPVTGVVTAVSFAGIDPIVTVDGKQIPYSHIVSIGAISPEATPPEDTGDQSPDPEPEPEIALL
ncbi:flagellar hook capping protein [Arthrobacter sp. MYb227]|uniref:flagellar hook capping FlgD N-terminal domain-containing protein n=1 Tax=Arthrobacter sp. MYb227 TaxID=1848601 RepID=UPI000CFE10B5|nr:flagellar hook capping FlgD N-terminal domain-containing protein [Arthrobacter sp. MYb227]PQZ96037.1 flagellar hook capping protein [Arthrobacter sp. MYb227]